MSGFFSSMRNAVFKLPGVSQLFGSAAANQANAVAHPEQNNQRNMRNNNIPRNNNVTRNNNITRRSQGMQNAIVSAGQIQNRTASVNLQAKQNNIGPNAYIGGTRRCRKNKSRRGQSVCSSRRSRSRRSSRSRR
jgi:hypothetical protein